MIPNLPSDNLSISNTDTNIPSITNTDTDTPPILDTDNLLNRLTIVGVLLAFRDLAQTALSDVLELRIPFLLTSVKDFQSTTDDQNLDKSDTPNMMV